MAYQLPSIPGFKGQFVRDFPYASPANPAGVVLATATAQINSTNQAVAGLTLDTPGSGLGKSVNVILYGYGVGALASATVVGGIVTALTLDQGGYGYTLAPYVYVSSGVGDNTDISKVTDYDLANAIIAAASFNLSESLWGSQQAFSYAYNLLAAHYLVETLQAGNTGLAGKAEWLTQSKSVGNVSENYAIPMGILNSPYLSKLSKTTYGAQFLELVSPRLIGNMGTLVGMTLP